MTCRSGRRVAAVVGLLLLTLAGGRRAAGHERSVSYSAWTIDGRNAHVVVRLTRLESTHLPWWSDASAQRRLARYVEERLRLVAGDTPCTASTPAQPLPAPEDWWAFEWRLTCPPDGALHLESTLLLDAAPSHLHMARVRRAPGARSIEVALAGGAPSPAIDADPGGATPGTRLSEYLALGVEHIATGYDHLAFLFALLLVGETIAAVAGIVTGFTVGHSLTLGLASLGWVRVESTPIEALIGLSIALVAAENVWLAGGRPRAIPLAVVGGLALLAAVAPGGVPRLALAGLTLFVACAFGLLQQATKPERVRWAVALLFGLIHGFGFAGILLEAELPSDRLLAALFGFNAGVEAGQLAIVAAAWPLLQWIRRQPWGPAALVEGGSAAALALGLFWFVARAYG